MSSMFSADKATTIVMTLFDKVEQTTLEIMNNPNDNYIRGKAAAYSEILNMTIRTMIANEDGTAPKLDMEHFKMPEIDLSHFTFKTSP